ncbi:MAG: Hsp70 family protein [Oscillospiraceae bacterium]
MLLSEYNKKDISQKQLADIMVQIMNIYLHSTIGHGAICPENIMVNTDTITESIGIISFAEKKGYSDTIYPVPADASEEKNDVFCLGILATYFMGGEFDLSEADLLCLNVEDGKPYVLCEPVRRDNEFCSLISRMTDLNPVTRPTMLECLKTIAAFQEGEAQIVIVDRNTGEELDCILCRLNDVVYNFYPQNLYEFNRRRYIPESMPHSGYLSVYYSVFSQKIPYYVTLDRPNPESMTVSCKASRLCIGIDFGTFSSSASYINASGRTESLVFDGTDYTPSAVFFNSESDMLFGSEAMRKGMQYPECLCTEIKRNFCSGKTINAVSHKNGTAIQKPSSFVVTKYIAYIKSEIEKKLGSTQNARFVLTVPACYDAGQKTALYTAASRVGIEPDILTEPEAAAIYFGAASESNSKIMVFDLGGGTLDVSILVSEIKNGRTSYSIKRRNGEEELGGVDFTKALCRYLCKKVYKKYGINVEADSYEDTGLDIHQFEYNKRVMLETAEIIKCALTRYEKYEKTVELYRAGNVSKTAVKISCDRDDYEINVIDSTDFLARMKSSVGKAITECGYTPNDIDELIITGGAAQTPMVLRMLSDFFKDYKCRINYIDHFSAISKGAAIYANNLETNNHSAQVLPETEYDIGLLVSGRFDSHTVFAPLISAGTKFNEGIIHTHAHCNLTPEEKAGRYCKLVLYRRPRGFESVNSPLEHDGDVIRPIGALYVDSFPEAFDPEKGRVHFTLTLNSQECISANIAFFMLTKSSGGLFGRKEISETRIGLQTALFIPNGQDD